MSMILCQLSPKSHVTATRSSEQSCITVVYINWKCWPDFYISLIESKVLKQKLLQINATFNDISVTVAVLLVEGTSVPGVNHRPADHRQTLSQNAVSSTPGYELESNWKPKKKILRAEKALESMSIVATYLYLSGTSYFYFMVIIFN